MESLNSFKDVYSDFKTDLENKMTQRKGRIKGKYCQPNTEVSY